jgi:hypothetical protein
VRDHDNRRTSARTTLAATALLSALSLSTLSLSAPSPSTASPSTLSPGGTRLSLPVARRTLIPADAAPGRGIPFTATVTGGVGRTVGQTSGFFLDVPAGRRSMTIDLTAEDSATELV